MTWTSTVPTPRAHARWAVVAADLNTLLDDNLDDLITAAAT